jgi:indole-3-glycerol phosphate synthase/phosphoribosylanthranilate isomerase
MPFGRTGTAAADLSVPGSTGGQPAGRSDEGILIAEIKRRSPSKGEIADIPDPAVLAGRYRDAGFHRVSVLTEETRFGGSLSDLIAVKTAHPELAVLRKDFLLGVDDIEVSWRAGADAVLLIATLLDADVFQEMYSRAAELGMAALVEVHTAEDVDMVRPLKPPLVGINSRDLRRFKVEPLLPLETRSFIDWPCEVIYESGISGVDDALFVRGSGFSGFLVGETVARSPELAGSLVAAWDDIEEARRRYGAWERLYRRKDRAVGDGDLPLLPLVKICGITNREDAEAAVDAGADILGFVLAESPRRASMNTIRGCADLPVLKAGVVVLDRDEELPGEIAALLEEGALDFIQFHGDETPETVREWPGYKALRLASVEDAEAMDDAGSPAVLVDAFSPEARGGTGKRLDEALVSAAAGRRRLWLAGGLSAENVGTIVKVWKPGLVDVSSAVEREKGLKDHDKVRRFAPAAKGRSPAGAEAQGSGGRGQQK